MFSTIQNIDVLVDIFGELFVCLASNIKHSVDARFDSKGSLISKI